ncbi:pentatricopeptide repeat-containing protein [Prunus yedoensis var. nudiflora]|uniref:Pentatricopeptide repeat-containing protein n=1 Tax=Prunus yedoensis var. nudiflora TaxID=2094558 RepID=A0A315A5V9_PRUYE|nr:pentatricopeptide repeat-containing protein [Prunus yedoensis var. nudiflora]
MPERDSVSWTSMIVGYNQMGRFGNAIQMFVDMISDGVTVTQFTITNILSACAAVKALDVGRKVHSFVVKLAVGSYVSVANCLLNMYAKSGDPRTAKIVFDRIRLKNTSSWNAMIYLHMQCGRADHALVQFKQMTERDVVSWNSMIAGYNQHGLDMEALTIFSSMLKDSFLKPDKFTLSSVLSACANLEKLEIGRQIHALYYNS